MNWTLLWLLWIAAFFVWVIAFFVIEIPAIRNKLPGDTLSEHTAAWFNTNTHHGRTVFVMTLAAFAAVTLGIFIWFSAHIVSHFAV